MYFSELFTHCPVCGAKSFVPHTEKSNRCTECSFVYYLNPSAAVAAFIQNQKGDLLVCVRAKEPAKGTWDLPGGFIDENETAEDAVRRELKEELNAEVVEAKYVFSFPNTYEYSGLTLPTLDMLFVCSVSNVNALVANDDVAAFQFVPLHEIDSSRFGLPSMKKAVALFLQMQGKI
jgi:ADP-ribose pyrophosphatase YjhB (NUDIX family)